MQNGFGGRGKCHEFSGGMLSFTCPLHTQVQMLSGWLDVDKAGGEKTAWFLFAGLF